MIRVQLTPFKKMMWCDNVNHRKLSECRLSQSAATRELEARLDTSYDARRHLIKWKSNRFFFCCFVISCRIGSRHSCIVIISNLSSHIPFFLCKDWWTFVPGDFCVVVNSNNQLIAQGLCLSKGIGVSKVYHVVAKKWQQANKVVIKTGINTKKSANTRKTKRFFMKVSQTWQAKCFCHTNDFLRLRDKF